MYLLKVTQTEQIQFSIALVIVLIKLTLGA